jgi:hypothetical protein
MFIRSLLFINSVYCKIELVISVQFINKSKNVVIFENPINFKTYNILSTNNSKEFIFYVDLRKDIRVSC